MYSDNIKFPSSKWVSKLGGGMYGR
jgi:hypothetical protein